MSRYSFFLSLCMVCLFNLPVKAQHYGMSTTDTFSILNHIVDLLLVKKVKESDLNDNLLNGNKVYFLAPQLGKHYWTYPIYQRTVVLVTDSSAISNIKSKYFYLYLSEFSLIDKDNVKVRVMGVYKDTVSYTIDILFYYDPYGTCYYRLI